MTDPVTNEIVTDLGRAALLISVLPDAVTKAVKSTVVVKVPRQVQIETLRTQLRWWTILGYSSEWDVPLYP